MASRNLPGPWRDNSIISSDWNPFREMSRMQGQLDRLLGDFGSPAFNPACDVKETDTHIVMSFDVPGVKKEDLKVNLRDGMLTVSGERQDEYEETHRNYNQSERFYGSFQRTFALPSDIKAEQIETDFKDGVLRIAVPKSESSKAQTIKIGEGKPGIWEKLLGHKKDEPKNKVEKAA